jgi:uncharacterized Zn finger protein
MTQRLRYKRQLVARIDGSYGVYRTRVRLGRRGDSQCSCPSEWWPCKHVRALAATWAANPNSFLDLDELLVALSTRPKAALLKLMAEMAIVAPESLSALGVKGFNLDEDSERGDGEEES